MENSGNFIMILLKSMEAVKEDLKHKINLAFNAVKETAQSTLIKGVLLINRAQNYIHKGGRVFK